MAASTVRWTIYPLFPATMPACQTAGLYHVLSAQQMALQRLKRRIGATVAIQDVRFPQIFENRCTKDWWNPWCGLDNRITSVQRVT